jgi:hypothetical protein
MLTPVGAKELVPVPGSNGSQRVPVTNATPCPIPCPYLAEPRRAPYDRSTIRSRCDHWFDQPVHVLPSPDRLHPE